MDVQLFFPHLENFAQPRKTWVWRSEVQDLLILSRSWDHPVEENAAAFELLASDDKEKCKGKGKGVSKGKGLCGPVLLLRMKPDKQGLQDLSLKTFFELMRPRRFTDLGLIYRSKAGQVCGRSFLTVVRHHPRAVSHLLAWRKTLGRMRCFPTAKT